MLEKVLLRSLLVLGTVCVLNGKTLEVNWTSQGVEAYRDPRNPLQAQLGDTLTLTCNANSNLFILADSVQYSNCNATDGSGMFVFNGFCVPDDTIMLTLTENSQNLMNTINFENNQQYYFASFSNGNLGNVGDQNMNVGGECTDGLKMVVLIGELITPGPGVTAGNRPPPNNENNNIIIIISASVAAGVVCLCLCLCLLATLILCCCCVKSKSSKVDQESSTCTDGRTSTSPGKNNLSPAGSKEKDTTESAPEKGSEHTGHKVLKKKYTGVETKQNDDHSLTPACSNKVLTNGDSSKSDRDRTVANNAVQNKGNASKRALYDLRNVPEKVNNGQKVCKNTASVRNGHSERQQTQVCMKDGVQRTSGPSKPSSSANKYVKLSSSAVKDKAVPKPQRPAPGPPTRGVPASTNVSKPSAQKSTSSCLPPDKFWRTATQSTQSVPASMQALKQPSDKSADRNGSRKTPTQSIPASIQAFKQDPDKSANRNGSRRTPTQSTQSVSASTHALKQPTNKSGTTSVAQNSKTTSTVFFKADNGVVKL